MRRSKNVVDYHGRSGRPKIHETEDGRRYIMVRKPEGGVKRLYQGSKYLDGQGRRRRLRLV